MAMRKNDYTPVEWNKYFEKFTDVRVESGKFRIYMLGSEGPVLFLLHGGGLSALGWSLFAVSNMNVILNYFGELLKDKSVCYLSLFSTSL